MSEIECLAGISGLVNCKGEEEEGKRRVDAIELTTAGGHGFLKDPASFTREKEEGGLECELGGEIGMVVCLTKYFDERAQP